MAHPVVREVFVHYLPHLGLLGVQYGGAEVEAHIQHGCLISQSCAPVLRQRVRRHLIRRKKTRDSRCTFDTTHNQVNP